MNQALDEFIWPVHEGGHRWIETDVLIRGEEEVRFNTPVRVLTDGEPANGRSHIRFYSPLTAHPGLFRTFAEIADSEAGVLAFADTYGLLGGDVSALLPPAKSDIRLPRTVSASSAKSEARTRS